MAGERLMKHRSPVGRVTHVPRPVEPVQGAEPSADYTRVSKQLIARQNQHGQIRERVQVEGMGQSRLAMTSTRTDGVHFETQQTAAGRLQQEAQSRGLSMSLSFEARARAAGVLGRQLPGQAFRDSVRAAELAHVYQSPR
jgi:hypothetical protein